MVGVKKSLDDLTNALSRLYDKATELNKTAINAYAILGIYPISTEFKYVVGSYNDYLARLQQTTSDCLHLVKKKVNDKRNLQKHLWEILKKLDAVFEQGDLSYQKVNGSHFYDPLTNIDEYYEDFDKFKETLVGSFVDSINRVLKNKSSEKKVAKLLPNYFTMLKTLYRQLDLNEIFNSLLEINDYFRSSELVDSYNALKRTVAEYLGIAPLERPYVAFIRPAAMRRSESNQNSRLTKLLLQQKTETETETEEKKKRNKLIKAVKRALDKDKSFDSLQRQIREYAQKVNLTAKAYTIMMSFFGPVLAENSDLDEKVKQYDVQKIGGLKEVKEELENHFGKLMDKKTARKHVLLYGAPGTGKTSLVYSYTNKYKDLKMVSVNHPAELDIAISLVKKHNNPFIIYVDDKSSFGSGEILELWASILDGKYVFPDNVEVVLTTNMEEMPEKMIQRFGTIIKFPKPDLEARYQIIDIYAKQFNVDYSKIRDDLAKRTEEYSGREIKSLFEELEEKGLTKTPEKIYELIDAREKNRPRQMGFATNK